MNKVLITGVAGFIGSHLAEELLNQGNFVVGIDDLSNGKLSNLENFKGNNSFRFIEADLVTYDLSQLEEFNFIHIFHLAALADIVPSIDNPTAYFKANVEATLNLLQFCRKQKISKFLYAASSSCYGIPTIFPTNENSEIDLRYPYALTKFQGEELVLHFGKVYKIPVISLRLFNVYGPRSRTSGTYGAVMGVFLKQMIESKPLTIVGDGSQLRDFVFVSDVVSAFIKASNLDSSNHVINIGSGQPKSIMQLAKLISENHIKIKKRPGEPDVTHADISKAKQLLNWTPKVELEEGVQEVKKHLEYWKDAPLWDEASIEVATKNWFKYLS